MVSLNRITKDLIRPDARRKKNKRKDSSLGEGYDSDASLQGKSVFFCLAKKGNSKAREKEFVIFVNVAKNGDRKRNPLPPSPLTSSHPVG
jgi:hypothetical protein